jgi:hypothetical protein
MGYRESGIDRHVSHKHRAPQMASIYAVMLCVFILLFLQFLMLTAALEGYLGGKQLFILPTVVVSGLCCALACKLIGYVLMAR